MERQLAEIQELPVTLWEIPDDEDVDDLEETYTRIAVMYGDEAADAARGFTQAILDYQAACRHHAEQFRRLARLWTALLIAAIALDLLAIATNATQLVQIGLSAVSVVALLGRQSCRERASFLGSCDTWPDGRV